MINNLNLSHCPSLFSSLKIKVFEFEHLNNLVDLENKNTCVHKVTVIFHLIHKFNQSFSMGIKAEGIVSIY